MQNQPGSDLVLPDRVRFGSNGTGPEASQCARIIRPASGKCFPADTDRMRIGPGMFTGHRGLGNLNGSMAEWLRKAESLVDTTVEGVKGVNPASSLDLFFYFVIM